MCHVEDSLQLTCTASDSVEFIRWSILQANEHGTLTEIATTVQINSRDANQMRQIEVTSATFTFMRTSAQGASPLVSTLSIDSVNIDLNETVVRCTDLTTHSSASTSIQIINSELVLIYL